MAKKKQQQSAVVVYTCSCGFHTDSNTKEDAADLGRHLLKLGRSEPGKHKSMGQIDQRTGRVVVRPEKHRTKAEATAVKTGKRDAFIEQTLKSQEKTPPTANEKNEPAADRDKAATENAEEKPPKEKIPKEKPATPSKQTRLGEINVITENWSIPQAGLFLIQDTYNRAKHDIGYTGSIGEYLVDVFTLHRRMMNYGEVEYVRRDGQGGNGHSEDGAESLQGELAAE